MPIVKRIPFKKFKEIYSTVPRLCVEVVYQKGKNLLLIKRTIEPAVGHWHTPGGTVLKGELLEEAVERVALEELGIPMKPIKSLGIIQYKSYVNHYSQDISVAYLVRPKNKKIGNIELDGHADEYKFFSEIPKDTILDQKEFYCKTLGMNICK